MIGRSSLMAALLSVALAGCGGTEIKGIIRDEESGQALPGAVVRVADETTRTGEGGFYELDVDLDDDEPAQVTVNAPGYEPRSMMVSFDEDQDTVYSDVGLKKEASRREADQEHRQFEQQRSQLEQERQALQEEKRVFEEQRRTQQEIWEAKQRTMRQAQQNEQLEESVDGAELDQAIDEAGGELETSPDQGIPEGPIQQPDGQ